MLTTECLAETILTSAQSTVSFNSIPSNYTDLGITLLTTASASDIFLQFNNDTSSNYSRIFLYSNASVVGSGRNSNVTNIALGAPGTDRVLSINIMSYSDTNVSKVVPWYVGSGGDDCAIAIGLWRSTSTINSINIFGPTFSAGSVFTLWGIK